ncbi:hypothetical protein OOT46_12165 [Aquabacterium sp. A7-Y]|uniref:hypothetical protein n=1 Tax=Aquabacterium sp. A7-Y TaxID=1349605 RepID=UPI00223D1547|nr:hypothetical protein [Aquabacterium sp. A7-Y]MCW7538597.1 hypothetical protein [Aquabacterium sp. A7-Y]
MATLFEQPPRSSFAQARAGDKVYVLGGHVGRYHTYPAANFSDELLEYELSTRSWRRLSRYPFAVQGLRMLATRDYLYAFGGFRYERGLDYPDWRPEEVGWPAVSDDSVFRYDIRRDRWSFVCQMPRRRSSNVLLHSGNRAFLVAGWDGTPRRRGDRSGSWHEAIDVFDLKEQAFVPWDQPMVPPLRRALASAEYGGRLLLVGGLGEAAGGAPPHFDSVTEFNPSTGRFNDTSFPRLPARLFAPGACWTGKWLVVAGGMDDRYQLRDTVYLLSPGISGWIEAPVRLPRPAMFPELIVLGPTRVLVLGGHGDGEQPQDQLPLGLVVELPLP